MNEGRTLRCVRPLLSRSMRLALGVLLGALLVGHWRYQEVGNDIATKRPIYKFGEFTHLISQLDHACSGLGLCSPDAFGRPLGIRKIVAVGAPMQARPQAALLIAYEFGQFQPGVLEVWLTTGSYFPSEVNRVHDMFVGMWPDAGVEPSMAVRRGGKIADRHDRQESARSDHRHIANVAASATLAHVTVDFLAVQLGFHFVPHSQALGNTTR